MLEENGTNPCHSSLHAQRLSIPTQCFSGRYIVCVPVDDDRVDIFTMVYRKVGNMKVRGREWEINRATVVVSSQKMPKSTHIHIRRGKQEKNY